VLQDLTADLGSTLPFQKPTMAGTPISPWEVSLDIDNKSDYANKLYLYRDDSLISILDTSANNYQDICQPLVNGSIVNGETNTYRLLAINLSDEDSIYGDDIISQSTYLVDFKASDNTVGGEVDISWNNLNDYVSHIVLLRDGNVLQELMSDDVSYTDITAIPGFNHIYSLELYIEDELKITFSDSGSVQANGSIVGRVFNSDVESPYSVSNAKVVAKALVAGKSYSFD